MRNFLLLPLVALTIAGCGSSGSSSDTTTSAPAATPTVPTASNGPQTVDISGFKYHPASLNVTAGTKVTWTNSDDAPHTATATGLDTGTLKKGDSKTLTLSKPGTYAYVCTFHPYMHGTITVK